MLVTRTSATQNASSNGTQREDTGTEFDVVTTAQPTEAIMMTDHALSTDCRNWFKVTFADGRIGWVHGRYVESDRAFSPF